jgi:hypothetical protein
MVETHVLPALAAVEDVKARLKDGASKVGQDRLKEMQRVLLTSRASLDRIFNPLAATRLIALDQLALVSIELQDWRAAYDALTASLPLYDFYYRDAGLTNHPLRGLQLMMHAKLAWLLEESQAALTSWQRALPILRITHGSKHELVRQIEEAIPPAQMEVMQRRQAPPQQQIAQ